MNKSQIVIDNELEIITNILSKSREYQNFYIGYVLEDIKNVKDSYMVAINDENNMIKIKVDTHEISPIEILSYNYDEDLFKELQNNKKIVYMNYEFHYNIWNFIQDLYPKDIDYKKGMQKYLNFCKRKGITKSLIQMEVKLDNIPDVMKLYKKNKERD